jgi:glycolate oxidase iron-sulfur subunit
MTLDTPASGFTTPDVPPESVYNQCVRCGLCLPACPTYLETLVETSSPRGRIALIKAVDEGRLAVTSPGFVHQMSECLDCRACEAVCPSGVMYGQLLEPARTQVVRAGASQRSPVTRFLRNLVLDGLFGNFAMLRAAATLLRFYQRSGLQRLIRASGLLHALRLERLEAQAPRISSRFFIPDDRRSRALGRNPKAVAFMHAGCVMHVAFADVDEATVRVLNRAGCDVVVPAAQGCCGAIAVHAGEMERGRHLAKANIAAFERSGADVYVINAAGCGSALKEYGHLFAGDPEWAERAAAFSSKVRDLTEFLDAVGIPSELGRIDAVAVYQDPCHLINAQRIAAAPRRLLARIPGLVVREIDEPAVCCGSAGTYNLTQPEMSERLLRRKIAHIVAAEPDVVATANPGCALQVAAGLRAAGRNIPVKHVVELLDEAYAAYSPAKRAADSLTAASSVG